MKLRCAVLSGALLVTVIGTTAVAAPPRRPKPVCNLVADVPSDNAAGVTGQKSPKADIKSVDFASDGKELTAVIRLAGMDTTPSTTGGLRYVAFFTAPGQASPLYLSVRVDTVQPEGPATDFGKVSDGTYMSFGGPPARGVVDQAAKEVRISVPITAFDKPNNLGAKLTAASRISSLGGSVLEHLTPYAQDPPKELDGATSKAVYQFGTPSCLRVGI